MTAPTQITLDGIFQGGLPALISVGFSLVWSVLGAVNLAHGAFVVGAYLILAPLGARRDAQS